MASLACRLRNIVLGAALASLWCGAALSQQSGTVLRENLTLSGSTTATMEIDVVGPKTANTETNLLLEFGPDGNSSTNPVPDPQLGATAVFTVSAGFGGSRSFTPSGGTETQVFADKIVSLEQLDPTHAPGLYALSIIHLKEIPVGVTETWQVLISGLPRVGLRAMASVRQGVFKSLTPTGVSQGPPAIAIEPSPIAPGSTAALVVTSSGGLDLSNVGLSRITITPGSGISNLGVGNATANRLVVSFTVDECAPAGSRTLTIQDQNFSASTAFAVAAAQQPPAISISSAKVLTGGAATLMVASTGCFDFKTAEVSINPADGISNVREVAVSTTGKAVWVRFDVAADAPLGNRTLVFRGMGGTVDAVFPVVQRPPPPLPPPQLCGPGLHCCGAVALGVCSACLPLRVPCVPRFPPEPLGRRISPE